MPSSGVAVICRWVGDSERWLAQFLEAVPSDPTIICVVIMGSAVRQRGHRRSDFDLLVVHRGKRPKIEAPIEIDIRFASIELAHAQINNGQEIVCWALKFGTAVYDPQGRWAHLREIWADRIPLPSATEARRRGEETLARATEMLEVGDDSAASDLALAAITQFVRERLIKAGIFPASRPELPEQLRRITETDPLADALEEAMYGEAPTGELLEVLLNAQDRI